MIKEYKKVYSVDQCNTEITRVQTLMNETDTKIKTMKDLVAKAQLKAWRKYRAALNKEKKYYELRLDLLQ